MRKKFLLEFIPIAIFFLSAIGVVFHVPYTKLIMLISGLFPATLYFYAAFWLFAETGMSIAIRILLGLLYSINILACMFCLLKWPLWRLYSIISYIGLGAIIIICLFNLKKAAYKEQLYRCTLFLVMLSMAYWYKILVV
jgi:hypothetical protein